MASGCLAFCHGLRYHWKAWESWEGFFVAWFIHTMAVGLLMAISLAAIIYSHKFFLGYEKEEYSREITFYIVMTILVCALGIAFIALRGPSDDGFDDSSAIVMYAV
jgi:hypothetical protein